jgi:hypothetical protein
VKQKILSPCNATGNSERSAIELKAEQTKYGKKRSKERRTPEGLPRISKEMMALRSQNS